MHKTDTIQHLTSWQCAMREIIKVALKKNEWKTALIAIPLALANGVANDFASAHQFRICSVEQVISESREKEAKEKGLIVYYFPTSMQEDENALFIASLQVYRDTTSNAVLLFVLLFQDTPIPDPSVLRCAWGTDLFQRRELYEVSASWNKVTLNCLKPMVLPLLRRWRRQQIVSWKEPFRGACNNR